FFFQAEDGIRDLYVTGVQTCALPIYEQRIGRRDGIEVLRCGGATRAATVRNAMAALTSHCKSDDWMLVHDAVRPCVPRDALARLVRELADDDVGGLLAIPVADTLKRAAADRAM